MKYLGDNFNQIFKFFAFSIFDALEIDTIGFGKEDF